MVPHSSGGGLRLDPLQQHLFWHGNLVERSGRLEQEREERRLQQEREDRRAEQEREDRRLQREQDREDRRLQREQDREDRRLQREQEDRRAEQEREDHHAQQERELELNRKLLAAAENESSRVWERSDAREKAQNKNLQLALTQEKPRRNAEANEDANPFDDL